MSAATTPDSTSPGLEAARAIMVRGWRPFPADHPALPRCAGTGERCRRNREKYGDCPREKRGKHPVGGWGTMTASEPTDRMLTLWFGEELRNVGLACGPSGLLVLDEDKLGALEALAKKLGEVLPVTYRVRTGRGWHTYFEDPGNEFGNSAGALADYDIDVRGGKGSGGYVLAAGSTHWSGHVYEAEDPFVAPAPLPEWIKTLIRTPAKKKTESQIKSAGAGQSDGEWNDLPRYGTEEQLRTQYERHVAAVHALAVPDARKPNGGEFRHALYLAALDGWRLVDCGLVDEHTMLRQMRDAVRAVWRTDPDDDDRTIVYDEAREKASVSRWVVRAQEDIDEDTPSSWLPIDLGPILRGEVQPARPAVGLFRKDGVQLLYPGKEHAVIGEMESGKSWFSLSCVAAELEAGHPVVYVHFEEDDPSDTVTRLLLLGATERQITEQFSFVAPASRVLPGGLDALIERKPSLVVLDGQNEGMSLHGLGIRDEDGAAGYRRLLAKPFTASGAAVLSCDHVVKDDERAGMGYALGSIHKGNGLNGVLILLENSEPFGRGRRGASRVYVTKDRPGQVRQHGKATKISRKFFMGMLSVDATKADALGLAFHPPSDRSNADSVLLLEEKWFDVLSQESVVPPEVVALRGKGANAARDIFRVLRYTSGQRRQDGLTTGEIRSILAEGPRPHDRSGVFAARSLLLEKGICKEGKTSSRIALEARFLGDSGQSLGDSGGVPRSPSRSPS